MARVSLIVLNPFGLDWPSDRVASYRATLEEAGFSIEIVAVSDPRAGLAGVCAEPWCRSVAAERPGLAESAITGLREARGQHLVLVDLAMPYTSDDVFEVVEALESGRTELAIAARPTGLVGSLTRRILGTTDPTSGLVGLTRNSAVEADDSFAPIGSRFTLELLARVAGRRVDLPVHGVRSISKTSTPFGDLRQIKRLADDRFGIASKLVQFCFVGASGMVVDLTIYAILQLLLLKTSLASMTAPVLGGILALAVARVLAIATALTWNFSINRRLTFNDTRQGSIPRQFLRYVLSNMLGIAVSLSLSLILPTKIGFFRDHRLAAAVVGIVAATGISFSMARYFVFGQKPVEAESRRVAKPRRRCAGLRSKEWTRVERTISTDRQTAAICTRAQDSLAR